MNWANRLTVARFFLTIGFVVSMTVRFPWNYTVSLALFILASITDYIDGEIARRFSMITDFGKLMDPLVDKIMMAAAFICLVPLGALPAWAVVVIISREFLITGLRLIALSNGTVLAAESLGKHKTGWQIATVIFFLALLSFAEFSGARMTAPQTLVRFVTVWKYGGAFFVTVTVALTLISGVGYFWKNRTLVQMK